MTSELDHPQWQLTWPPPSLGPCLNTVCNLPLLEPNDLVIIIFINYGKWHDGMKSDKYFSNSSSLLPPKEPF